MGGPITGITPLRTGIGQKAPAVGKPGANTKTEGIAVDTLRLRNHLHFAGFNKLKVQPDSIRVSQVSSIGRDGAAHRAILAGDTGELTQFEFRQRHRRRWLP